MAKKEKKESKLRQKINELKKTSRGKAILKLIRWAIFFLCVFIFCLIASMITSNYPNHDNTNKEPIKEELKEETLEESIKRMSESLINSSYNFSYEINSNDIRHVYNGTKDSVISGYKETNMGIIKYIIEETGTYQIIGEEKIVITNLYENLNENYLNLSYIFNIINNLSLKEENSTNNYVVKASDTLNNYTIYYDKDKTNINSIIIEAQDNSYTYNLSFTNIRSN